MGSYATTTSLGDILPYFLKGNTSTSDSAGIAMFSKHIDRAEAMINAACAQWYSLPFSSIPPLLTTMAEDIACYYAIRAAYTQDGQNKNAYQDSFKYALSSLEKIQSGELKLSDSTGSQIAVRTTTRMLSSTEGFTPIFNKDDPKNWALDTDEQTAIEDARD